MTWQEYQDAVGELYDQATGIGTVRKNVTLPDKVTGQPRQIDVWLETECKGHVLGILIDAKFRQDKVDVKDVEEVLALAHAVGANLSVLVALNGWTKPAAVKAKFVGLDLRLLTMDEALDLIVPEKWTMCPHCGRDCIVADKQGGYIVDGLWSLIVAGQCRSCKAALIWCWDCGSHVIVEPDMEYECGCEHVWHNNSNGIIIKRRDSKQWIDLSNIYDSIEEFVLDLPEPTEPTYGDTDFYVQRGIANLKRGQGDAAISDFSQALLLTPHSTLAYYHRGYTYDMAECIEQAIEDYGKAIELDPKFAMALASRGAVYYSQTHYHKAIEDFKRFLELMPDSPDVPRIQAAIENSEFELATLQTDT